MGIRSNNKRDASEIAKHLMKMYGGLQAGGHQESAGVQFDRETFEHTFPRMEIEEKTNPAERERCFLTRILAGPGNQQEKAARLG